MGLNATYVMTMNSKQTKDKIHYITLYAKCNML